MCLSFSAALAGFVGLVFTCVYPIEFFDKFLGVSYSLLEALELLDCYQHTGFFLSCGNVWFGYLYLRFVGLPGHKR